MSTTFDAQASQHSPPRVSNGSSGSNKFNTFVRKSMDKASSVLKLVPPPPDKNGSTAVVEALTEKKEHRRAQVRKAQIEHRQRKENHVKTLEQEISDLRDMIDKVETQSHLFKIENEAIKKALKEQASSSVHSPITNNQLCIPVAPALSTSHYTTPSSQSSFATTPATATGSRDLDLNDLDLDLDLNLDFDQKLFDSIASVGFDEVMDVSYLQLQPLAEHEVFGNIETPIRNPFEQTIKKEEAPAHLLVQGQIPTYPPPLPVDQNTNTDMDASYENPEVALLAINFILALEYPCHTHFLPKSTHPTPGLPILPPHVPSGHELMASTYLYTHAPLPVFQTMHHHWKSSTPPPPPCSSTSPPLWKVPSSPKEELQKLWKMSSSLSKEDWEITPVQAWFLLVEALGTEVLMRKGVVEELKKNLGKLVECFGFGATMNEGLFWGVVGEVEVMKR